MKKHIYSLFLVGSLIGCGSSDSETSKNIRSLSTYEVYGGVTDTINVDENNKEDWFSVTLTPDIYSLYGELLAGTTYNQLENIHITIYDKNDLKVLNKSIGFREGDFLLKDFKVDKSATYKIKVARDGGGWSNKNEPAKYMFKLINSLETGYTQDKNGEINDNVYLATPIDIDRLKNGIQGTLNTKRKSDIADWYSVDLTVDNYTLLANLLQGTAHDPNFFARVTIYDPQDLKIFTTRIGSQADEFINEIVNITEDGTYKIEITRDGDRKTAYSFNLFHSTKKGYTHDSDGEINDNIYMATPITLSKLNSGISGDINIKRVSDTADWYSVSLASKSYDINTSLLTGTPYEPGDDAQLFIYNSDGVQVYKQNLGFKQDTNTTSIFTVDQNATYTLKISRELNKKALYSISFH